MVTALVCVMNNASLNPLQWLAQGFAGTKELYGVDYATFSKECNTSPFDPVGCSEIYYFVRWGRDNGIALMKCNVSERDYKRLLKQLRLTIGRKSDPLTQGAAVDGFGIENNIPLWWKPPRSNLPTVEVVEFESGGRRRTFVFDRDTSLLWAMERW